MLNYIERSLSPTESALCNILTIYKIDYELSWWEFLNILITDKKSFNFFVELLKKVDFRKYFWYNFSFYIDKDSFILIKNWHETILVKYRKDIIDLVKDTLLTILNKF